MQINHLEDFVPSVTAAAESTLNTAAVSCPHWTPLTDEHMQLMHVHELGTAHLSQDGVQTHAMHALRIPALLPVESSALFTWSQHTQRICECFGLLNSASSGWQAAADSRLPAADRESKLEKSAVREGASSNASGHRDATTRSASQAPRPPSIMELSLAQLQHACSVACGHHRTTSALPEPDTFLLLMHVLFGTTATSKLPSLLEAVSAAPAGRFVWPAYSMAIHGPQPLLMLCFTARVMLAAEYPDVFAVMKHAKCTNEILLKWLQGSLLPVLSVRCACRVTVLGLVCSPLVMAAAAVAVLGELRSCLEGAVASGADGDGTLTDWAHAVHCFDAEESEVIARALQIEGRHRDAILPLLLSPTVDVKL
jgi:hypothetical protein